MSGRRDWDPILSEAASYASGGATLRQVHYRLVSNPDSDYRNAENDYKQLSKRTAEARRQGWFPGLTDRTRSIEWRGGVESVPEALADAADDYQRDYTVGQPIEVWVIVEKATLLGQVQQWLDPFGTMFTALRGYGSQTIADLIGRTAGYQKATEVHLLYIGDHDPSGQDIQRDIIERAGVAWDDVTRLAVNPEQIDEYGLHRAPGKRTDSRAGRFEAQHGELIQVEVEAIAPADLQQLVVDAVEERTDMVLLEEVKAQEVDEREQIMEFIASFE